VSNTYSVRIYESTDGKNLTSAGTIVALNGRTVNLYAYTAGEVESSIRERVRKGTLPSGKVYQICPGVGNSELIRSIAVLSDGSFERVFLDPAQGSFGEFRRIRFANTLPSPGTENPTHVAQGLESLTHRIGEQTPVDSYMTERQKT
jgi:hypothetical protein